MNEQQTFWRKKYSKEYIDNNSDFDADLGIECWNKILHNGTL